MLPVERRQFILDELYKNKAVAVNELAQQLGVTTMTIRRDLQLLEDNGLVEKSHGGAVLTESLVKEATYHNRKLVRIQEKPAPTAASDAENVKRPVNLRLSQLKTTWQESILKSVRTAASARRNVLPVQSII